MHRSPIDVVYRLIGKERSTRLAVVLVMLGSSVATLQVIRHLSVVMDSEIVAFLDHLGQVARVLVPMLIAEAILRIAPVDWRYRSLPSGAFVGALVILFLMVCEQSFHLSIHSADASGLSELVFQFDPYTFAGVVLGIPFVVRFFRITVRGSKRDQKT